MVLYDIPRFVRHAQPEVEATRGKNSTIQVCGLNIYVDASTSTAASITTGTLQFTSNLGDFLVSPFLFLVGIPVY